MALEDVIDRVLSSEKFEDMNGCVVLASEEMTTIWKNYLTTALVWKLLVALHAVLEYIHHFHAIEETQN